MKIIYVGAGAACLISAIALKSSNPSLEILILEKNNIIGKKLKATGNGKCNILPISDDLDSYYNSDFVKSVIGNYSKFIIEKQLNNIGIYIKKIGDYGYYPISESANNVVNLLLNKINELNIEVKYNTKVLDYIVDKQIKVITDQGDYLCDKLVFSNGGCAAKHLGGDNSLFNVFSKHGYDVKQLKPILCPIKVKENVKSLFGARNQAKVSLFDRNNNLLKEEYGEIQFKKDGVSGICIFNLTRYISGTDNYVLIDFLHNKETNISKEIFTAASKNNSNYLYTFISKPIADYIKNSTKNVAAQYNLLTNFKLNILSTYDFEDAHVSRGGVSLSNINLDLSSKIENNVYFIGETLDVDGPCGGYNLKFAFASGIAIKDALNLKK